MLAVAAAFAQVVDVRHGDLRQPLIAGFGEFVILPVQDLLRSRSAQRLVRLIHCRQQRDIGRCVTGREALPRPCRLLTIPLSVYWLISRVTCARLSPVTLAMYRFTRPLPLRRRLL